MNKEQRKKLEKKNYKKYGSKKPQLTAKQEIKQVFKSIIAKNLQATIPITSQKKNDFRNDIWNHEDKLTNRHVDMERTTVKCQNQEDLLPQVGDYEVLH